jgi:hypothetical protein
LGLRDAGDGIEVPRLNGRLFDSVMGKITPVGPGPAKPVFTAHGVDGNGRTDLRRICAATNGPRSTAGSWTRFRAFSIRNTAARSPIRVIATPTRKRRSGRVGVRSPLDQ